MPTYPHLAYPRVCTTPTTLPPPRKIQNGRKGGGRLLAFCPHALPLPILHSRPACPRRPWTPGTSPPGRTSGSWQRASSRGPPRPRSLTSPGALPPLTLGPRSPADFGLFVFTTLLGTRTRPLLLRSSGIPPPPEESTSYSRGAAWVTCCKIQHLHWSFRLSIYSSFSTKGCTKMSENNVTHIEWFPCLNCKLSQFT